MPDDAIDEIVMQWSQERPDLDSAALSVVARILRLHKPLKKQAEWALKPLDISLWEYDVLSALRRQGEPFRLPATELAATTGLSAGAMTNRIDRLERRGYVRRASDKKDRRGVKISLTKSGVLIADKASALRFVAANEALLDLSSQERETLSALLRKIATSNKT